MNAAGERVERFRAARRDPELCVLEGLHALKHALRFGAEVREVVTRDPVELRRLAESLAPDQAAAMGLLAVGVGAAEYESLAPLAHPTGVMSIARRRAWAAASQPREDGAATVFVESPVHLGNLGAVIRVAAAAGAAAVLCSGRHDPWSPEAVRAAAGLQFAVPVLRVNGVPEAPGRIVAMGAGGAPAFASPIPRSPVLAFGSERAGLSDGVIAAADVHLALPMREGVSSLNLATAVAATLYGLRAANRLP